MLSFTEGLKVFAALEQVDLRKTFSRLEVAGERVLGRGLAQRGTFCVCQPPP